MKMKKIIMFCAAVFAHFAFAESEVVNGVTWYYSTYEDYVNGQYRNYAQITSGADKYAGDLTVPTTLGGYQVRRIDYSAFSDCYGLTGITLPSGVVRIEGYAFSGCSGLLNVSLPGTLTHIGYDAFYGCSGLTRVVIPDSVTIMGSYAFYNCSALQTVTLSRNLTSIPNYCFYGCSSLQSIVLPDGLKTIGEYAFHGCTSLADVTLPNGLTSIDYYAFSGCTALSDVTLPNGLTSIGASAFSDCTALSDVTLPNGLTSIGAYAFCNCDSFTRFDIPATVESMGTRVIGGCDNLKTITVAAGNTNVKVVNNCLVSYSGSTLLAVPFGCATVDIPQGVTAIPENMFSYDANLVNVTIPQGVTSIGGYAFYSCGSLTAVSLPDGLMTIGGEAFAYCNLAEIILPASVTTVGNESFSGGNYTSCRVVPLGAPPSWIVYSGLLSYDNISYPREYGAAWLEIWNDVSMFTGYNPANWPVVEYVSVAVRESDPTLLDVVYRVRSAKPTVKVRALAFKDGVRSFANVVRPETFIEGTEANVGDAISANVEQKLTWRVSSDWQIDLAKVKFEVLAVEENLLPLELVTIPANGSKKAMEISWNAITESQLFDALLWLYADKTEGLTLADGVLRDGDNIVAYGTNASTISGRSRQNINGTSAYYYFTMAPEYVFSKMGYSTLSGDELSYANAMTRLGLSPSGVRQYAYRWIEAQ